VSISLSENVRTPIVIVLVLDWSVPGSQSIRTSIALDENRRLLPERLSSA
jgi:hypothetical protein